MRYWWVNQNQTYKYEVRGGFLWSPKCNKDGRRNRFYDNMMYVRPGDIVFSFCNTKIRSIGIVQEKAYSAERPEFGSIGEQWNNEGWLIRVQFLECINPVRPKDFIEKLVPYLASKYAPLQANGNGNQGVYLAEISEQFACVLLERMGLRLQI